jgi:hypothetical protein
LELSWFIFAGGEYRILYRYIPPLAINVLRAERSNMIQIRRLLELCGVEEPFKKKRSARFQFDQETDRTEFKTVWRRSA